MPVATPRGGAEHQLQQLVEYREQARLEPTVALLRPGPMVGWGRERGVASVVIDAGRLRQPRPLGRAVRALAKIAVANRSDVVVGWMAKGQIYGGLAATRTRIPSVWLQPA